MPDLSPAAQSVWDAFNEDEAGVFVDYGDKLAAALRASVEQILPENANPVGDLHDDARHDQWMRIRYKFLALAAELERLTVQEISNLPRISDSLASSQVELDAESKEVLHANLWDLYIIPNKPEGPTDDELNTLWNCCGIADEYGRHEGNFFDFARAVLARWGNRQEMLDSSPADDEPEGPTDEEVEAWVDQQGFIRGHGDHPCGFWIDDGDAGVLVRAALARWGK